MRGHLRQYCWTSKDFYTEAGNAVTAPGLFVEMKARPTFVAVPRNSCCL